MEVGLGKGLKGFGRLSRGYISEGRLLEQIVELIDKLNLGESGLRKQFDAEAARNRRFIRGVMGIKEKRSDQRDCVCG